MEPIERRREQEEELRRRMRWWALDRLRLTMTEIAEATGESYKNVQNWMGTGARRKTIPASFLVAFAQAVPVNPEWLLTEQGRPEPIARSRKAAAFDQIAAIVAQTLEGGGDGGGEGVPHVPPAALRPQLEPEGREPGPRQRRA